MLGWLRYVPLILGTYPIPVPSWHILVSMGLCFVFIVVFLQSTFGFGQKPPLHNPLNFTISRDQLKCDGTRSETRFRLSAKRTSPFKPAGASVQSTTGSRGVRISDCSAGYTMFRGSVKGTHSIHQFSLHFPSRASPCAITFQLTSTHYHSVQLIQFKHK